MLWLSCFGPNFHGHSIITGGLMWWCTAHWTVLISLDFLFEIFFRCGLLLSSAHRAFYMICSKLTLWTSWLNSHQQDVTLELFLKGYQFFFSFFYVASLTLSCPQFWRWLIGIRAAFCDHEGSEVYWLPRQDSLRLLNSKHSYEDHFHTEASS